MISSSVPETVKIMSELSGSVAVTVPILNLLSGTVNIAFDVKVGEVSSTSTIETVIACVELLTPSLTLTDIEYEDWTS